MIVVVADTSPIRYLVRIGQINLLTTLYGRVILPGVVHDELQAADGLLVVREWTRQLPSWVSVQTPSRMLNLSLPNLHRGESDAIALAEELSASLLLIDDRIGVQVALERGLTVTGTLGILVEAAQAGIVYIDPVLAKLKETNFRATPGLYERARQLALSKPPVLPRRKQE